MVGCGNHVTKCVHRIKAKAESYVDTSRTAALWASSMSGMPSLMLETEINIVINCDAFPTFL